jgi:cell division septum initiation protein DivIVA
MLIAHDKMTADEARRQDFPAAFKGLDRQSVEEFRRRTANALEEREREIARLAGQLAGLQAELNERPAGAGLGGVDVLARATLQADQIIADAQAAAHDITANAEQQREAALTAARQQHDRILGAARQQAGGIVGRATMEAKREHDRIVSTAPADAQRALAHYTALAAAARAGLQSSLHSLGDQVRGWTEQAQQDPPGQPAETSRS